MPAVWDSAAASLQMTPDGRLCHLLTLAGVRKRLLCDIFAEADACAADRSQRPLAGKLFVNIFFESSTRTRTAFAAAAKQLGADVVNLDRTTMAEHDKGETLEDTVRTVAALGASGVALRHSESGAAVRAAQAAELTGMAVINGGTGCEAHPTQGLTDAYTLREMAGDDFSGLAAAIVGDVLHSRVARSNVQVLRAMGMSDIRLVGPPSLCPLSLQEELGAPVFDGMDEGLDGVDVVLLLRVQRERLSGGLAAPAAYFADYGLTEKRLAALKKSAVVMHPGPINRGMEIADVAADGAQSRILRQVANGVVIRRAVLTRLCG